ncbi:MAG: amidohydrolase family protein, partial [Streptomycetaceae bacterium]|nr:amidohydrolase family protein [Streptomycetaceae bacterium]
MEDGRVVAAGPRDDVPRPTGDDLVIDARGGALVHGLVDHHTHLHALAAAMRSVDCGPPNVRTRDALAAALRRAAGTDGYETAVGATRAAVPGMAPPTALPWLRGFNYHESVAGDLTRDDLDAIEPARPLRVQHRGGALWVVNSAGLRALGWDATDTPLPQGVETDATGRPTGRLWRLDDRIRERIPSTLPDLAEVGRRYASFGITHLVDATPDLDADAARHLADAVRSGALPQRLT